MLRDIRIVSPDTVTAIGPNFDRAKSHAVMNKVTKDIRRLIAEATGETPAVYGRCSVSQPWQICAIDTIFREFVEFCETVPYECSSEELHLRINDLSLRISPCGWGSLFEGDGTLVTTAGQPAEQLDIAPSMMVVAHSNRLALSAADRELVTKAFLASAKAHGTDPKLDKGKVGPLALLRFPHATFGTGEGPLRIRLISNRTPATLN